MSKKTTITELRAMVRESLSDILSEAKKKKAKADKIRGQKGPEGYQHSEAFDFSEPLGGYNLYKSQGASNWGPMTGPGPKIDDRQHSNHPLAPKGNEIVRMVVKDVVSEDASRDPWKFLSEIVDPSSLTESSPWNAASKAVSIEEKANFRKVVSKLAQGEDTDKEGKQKKAATGRKK